MWTFYQGRRAFEIFNAIQKIGLYEHQAKDAAHLRWRLEEAEFVVIAYRPVRWLRHAVNDGIADAAAAETYLKHAQNLEEVRHKREHYDEYIPLGKRAGKLRMIEGEGGSSDPTGTRGTDGKIVLGNLVDVAEIMAAARDTHAALAASGFWEAWEVRPFDLMDR